MLDVDYGKVGLKVGIEIHRQLDTAHKLFCNCPTTLSKKAPEMKFLRRLRPSESELGEIDPAALFEFQKGLSILYEADSRTSCLVEMDEEPPHDLNREAVDVCLQVALLLKSKPVDEVHVMRKIVIDGSNTCGFQRTCVIAIGGFLEVEGKEIPVQAICLEEDAARKMGEGEYKNIYRLDRLGVPLIETTTAPLTCTPAEAGKVALAIGRVLKATGKVKRGIGSVRQDLNISIREGALIEVKGVQELGLIPKVIEYEVQRQLKILEIREELKSRNVSDKDIVENFIDVTQVFKESRSNNIRSSIVEGGVVLAVKLPGLAGLLNIELEPNVRFGTELADRAKFFGGVGGLFHTDELPGYGVTQAELDEFRSKLKLGNLDAAVLVADKFEKAKKALTAVAGRVRESLRGVPEETRAARPDGTTRYMRPRPGPARLYPETDVPPITISSSWLDRVRKNLPPLPEELVNHLMVKYSVNRKLAEQLADSDYLPLFEKIIRDTGVAPSFVATAVTEIMKSLERKAVAVENLTDEQIFEVFKLIGDGKIAKEMLPDILELLVQKGGSPSEVLEQLGFKMLKVEEIESIINSRIHERVRYIREHPEEAFNHVMKLVMSEVRGRADAKVVARMVKEGIKKLDETDKPP